MRKPRPHARQEGQASSVTRPLEGRLETKKARSVVASSRVHSWRTSVSRSPPTAGLGVGLEAPAAVRPLVRMPTDRHAATGTCELGRDYLRKYGQGFKARSGKFRSFFRRSLPVWPLLRSGR